MGSRLSRRHLLKSVGVLSVGALLAASQPKGVKETIIVVVEKQIEKEVTKIVEKQVEVVKASTRGPKIVFWWDNTFMEAYNEYCKDSATITALEGNFEVDFVQNPQNSTSQKLLVASEAGTLPDISGSAVSIYHAQGTLIDVSDVVAEIAPTGRGFYQGQMDLATIDGKQWTVPWNSSTQNLYYRSDILGKA